MPTSSFPEYAQAISQSLERLLAIGQAQSLQLHVDHRSGLRGFISGVLIFADDSELHFREFVDVTQFEPRLMYAYHYQNAEKVLIFRYDNAPHRPTLLQPEHKHTLQSVVLSSPPTLIHVLDEILR